MPVATVVGKYRLQTASSRDSNKQPALLQITSSVANDSKNKAKFGFGLTKSVTAVQHSRPSDAHRVARSAANWNSQPMSFGFNNERQLKKLISVLTDESKNADNSEYHVDQLQAANKLTKRGLADYADDVNDGGFEEWLGGDRLVKRQPLDKIDVPNRWRHILKPKLGRSFWKRQPLDRIDEPNSWRRLMVPKLVGEKRQPLDRIDQPNRWRDRIVPKYMRFRHTSKREAVDSKFNEFDIQRNALGNKVDGLSETINNTGHVTPKWSRDNSN